MPKTLLTAKPNIENKLINGYTKIVKIEEFKVEAKENFRNCPFA